jgi:hypothetical protein
MFLAIREPDFNTFKTIYMPVTNYTRPARRSVTNDAGQDGPCPEPIEYHAPYLHEDCAQCEAALLESMDEANWQTPDLLPALNEAWFGQPELDAFNVYRHFHPFYSYNYAPYEKHFKLVARPGRQLLNDLLVGDILLLRSILSNRTIQAIITDPRLRTHEDLGAAYAQKPGAYVQVFGNAWGNGNSTGFVRVQNNRRRTPDDVVVIRKIQPGQSPQESEAVTTDNMEAIKEYNLKYVKYGSGGGYMFAGDHSINYPELFAANNLSDFEAKAARHFLETEGGIDSINTYDNQVITWGFGFAGKPGNLTIALHLLLQANEQARNDFNSCGITLGSEKKTSLTITDNGNTYTGDDALRFWKQSKPHLNALIQLTQQYAKDAFNAQWQTFKRIHQAVFNAFNDPLYLANISNEAERNKAKVAALHAHHHYPGFNPPASFRNATSFEEVLSIYVNQSSKYGSVQGHANSWRRSLNAIFSGNAPVPAPPTPPAPTPVTPGNGGHTTLTGSVGKGAQNQPGDVLQVQTLLQRAGINIAATGQIQDNEGDPTVLAIYHYQAKKKLPAYDGRIDPNGGTLKALLKEAPVAVAAESTGDFTDDVELEDYPEWTTDESEAAAEAPAADMESEDKAETALEFEWLNMKPVLHPNGYKRIYYVTSGKLDANEPCYFPFIIRNKLESGFFDANPFGSFLVKVYAQVQLSRTAANKRIKWTIATKDGSMETIWKKIPLAATMKPGEEKKFGSVIALSQAMLQKARNASDDDLSARMDVEVYYTNQEYFTAREYVQKKSLAFYLVRPVEYVFGTRLRVKPDRKKEQQLISQLRTNLFSIPTNIKTTVTIGISKTETTTDGKTFTFSQSHESSEKTEVSVKIPFSALVEGLEIGASNATEVKDAIAHSYSQEKSFSSQTGDSFTYTLEIPTAPGKGKYRHISIEPKLVAIPIDKAFHYGQINDYGMAGKVEEVNIPFIYKIDGWHVNANEFGND